MNQYPQNSQSPIMVPKPSHSKLKRDLVILILFIGAGIVAWNIQYGDMGMWLRRDWRELISEFSVGPEASLDTEETPVIDTPKSRGEINGTPEIVSGAFYADRVRDIVIAFECEDNPDAAWYCDDPQFVTQAARKWGTEVYVWGTGSTGANRNLWWLAKELNGSMNTIMIEEKGKLGLCEDMAEFPVNIFDNRFADCRNQ